MEYNLRYCTQLLKSCNSINQTKQIHLLLLKNGVFNSVIALGNRLLQLYSKAGEMSSAAKLFDEMPERNYFSWNTLIEGYMKSGNREKSLEYFNSMPCKNDFSWNVVLSGCVKAGDLSFGRMLFNEMPSKNGMDWNLMIHGYARNGFPRQALRLFKDMTFELGEAGWRDHFVLATVTGACADLMAYEYGRQIHARIVIDGVEFDSVLGSSLVNLYSKCGFLDNAKHVVGSMKEVDDFSLSSLITGYANVGRMKDAQVIFDSIAKPCVVVWNSLITGYVTNNEGNEALILFNMMRNNGFKPEFSILNSALNACATTRALQHGKQLHNLTLKSGISQDIVVACSVISMYTKCKVPDDACKFFREVKHRDTPLLNSMICTYSNCGRVNEAKEIFDNMQHKTLISWNSMLAGFAQNGSPESTLHIFREMNKREIRMDKFTLASAISACASITSREFGEQIFARATVLGLEGDLIVSTSLIDLYCKCGTVNLGRNLFNNMIKPDVASWNSMLTGYANNGQAMEVFSLFADMRHSGVKPDDVTFTVILSACRYCGLIEEARKLFHLMQSDYHIKPAYEHYTCMVDLLARAGCLDEAVHLIRQTSFQDDVVIWSSVLRGCVAHGNKILGKEVAEMIIQLDPENSGAYIQLSGMFATSGDWDGSTQVRDTMRAKHLEKNAGISW
ncbi:putative pentatricopeptide repeat-containing protein At1g77010, mitochondrial [Silene latifolia]|uniref:putative pentatricopeptide repeat-containing protein At1g77010, mitochondrial n=1 Tax=Silene latifolia TaxID=37657 RepID=UPI003D771EB3